MAKLNLSDVTNITGQESSAIAAINNNSAAIEEAFDNTLSRDGTSPNTMMADLDMNERDIMNVATLTVESIVLDGITLAADDIQAVGPQGPQGEPGEQGPAGTTSPEATTSDTGTVILGTLAQVLAGTANRVPTTDVIKAIIDLIDPLGQPKPFFSVPSGYLHCNGQTIGNGSSGATARANADTLNLFTYLWNSVANTELSIQTSTGVPSTRGISAAADFAANKRLPLPDLQDRFLRGMPSAGRNVASFQDDAFEAHTHTGTTDSGGTHSHTLGLTNSFGDANDALVGNGSRNFSTSTNSGGAHTHTFTTSSSGDTETRPKNVTVYYCLRY